MLAKWCYKIMALILGSLADRVKQGPCLHIDNFSSGAELREMRQWDWHDLLSSSRCSGPAYGQHEWIHPLVQMETNYLILYDSV